MSNLRYTINPFPGIRNFEPGEDFLFFGRDQQINDVLGRLSITHFMALIGYSGSGKSSLIKAGIIPGITKSAVVATGAWTTIYFRPGEKPFVSMADALLSATGINTYEDNEHLIEQVAGYLNEEDITLKKVYEKYKHNDEKNWFIIIDQFEEIFRFRNAEDKADTQQFINLLLSGLSDSSLPVYIMVSMRSDFLDSCTEFTDLPEAINKGSYLLPKVTTAGIYDIITKPIEVCNGQISPLLVSRLMNDVKDDLDLLPVLQHAMMRTWDYWKLLKGTDKEISIKHYEAIGTISSALSIHAEEIYQGLNERKQKIAEKLFKALTDVTINSRGTRRPARLKELAELANVQEQEVIDVIDEFRAPGRAFLMPVYSIGLDSETIIDIAHESIMRVWDRLKEWVYAEEKSVELYLRLSKAADLYQQGKAGLWVDPDLSQAIKWQQDNNPTLIWATRYDPAFERAMSFLEYSKKEYLFKIEQKARKQVNDLRSARRTALILGTASILSILLLVFSLNLRFKAEASEKRALENGKKLKAEGVEADMQKKQAILQEKIAEQQQSIASQQQALAEEQKVTAISERKNAELQKLVAVAQKQEAEAQRRQALYQKRQADTARIAAIDSGKVAQLQRDNAIQSRHEVENLRMLSEARSIAFKSNQLSGDAQQDTLSMQMAFLSYVINNEYGGAAQNRAIYDALKSQLNRYYNKVLRYTYGVKTNPGNYDLRSAVFINNNDFFTAGDDGTVREWTFSPNPLNIKIKKTSKTLGESIHNISLSADRRHLLAISSGGTLMVWDTGNISSAAKELGDLSIQYATFLPLATGDDEKLFIKSTRYAYVYSFGKSGFKLQNRYELCKGQADNSSQAGCYQVKKDIVNVFVAEGTAICTLSFNKQADMVAQTLFNVNQKVSTMTVNGNGNTLAVGTDAGLIFLYNIVNAKPTLDEKISIHSSRVTGLSFTKNEATLASGSLDNTIKIEKLQDESNKSENLIFQDRKGWIRDIVISPNNRYVLSVGQSGVIQLWPLTELTVLQELTDAQVNKKILTGNLKERELEKEIGADIYKRLWYGKYKNFKDFWNSMTKKYIERSA